MKYVIKRGSEYLVAVLHTVPVSFRWSIYAYDAVRIDRLEDARKVARISGGDILQFDSARGVVE